MTLAEFISCSLLAFGAPLVMFTMTIANNPVRIIIMLTAAFGWLVSFLISSLIWFVAVPLRTYLSFGLVLTVSIQEFFRYGIYWLLKKLEDALKEISVEEEMGRHKLEIAYVAGVGFGSISSAYSIVNVISDSAGPGTVGLQDGNEYFFVTSAATTLCLMLLNTFWNIIFFHGLNEHKYKKIAYVICTHFIVTLLSLLNRDRLYLASLLPSYIILILTAVIAFKSSGGSFIALIQTLNLNCIISYT